MGNKLNRPAFRGLGLACIALVFGLLQGCHPQSAANSTATVADRANIAAATTQSVAAEAPAATPAPAATADAPAKVVQEVLFKNVRVFDGTGSPVSGPSNVLVRGNHIAKVSTDPIQTDPGAKVTVIDGGGRTLMPGLIDMHWHMMMVRPTITQMLNDDIGYLNLLAAGESKDTLLRGFTTVRDMGGPTFALKKAIDNGVTEGPRIYPSGAMITITGGHGDFRHAYELPRTIGKPASRAEDLGGAVIADGVDEVLVRVREQLFQGASQIKLTAGGGVASPHSPLDVSTFTEPELRAAVEAASNWGTYVAVHAYTPEAIQRAIKAGVKSIEHGQLMDDATAKMMADKGVWLSTQVFFPQMAEAFSRESGQRDQALKVFGGAINTLKLAKKYHIKTVFGTDILFSPQLATQQGALLAMWTQVFTPAEVLNMATGNAGKLLALSGERNPYPGMLGEVKEGALADLLLVDGDPTQDIKLLAHPHKNLLVIMKNGKIYKNTVPH